MRTPEAFNPIAGGAACVLPADCVPPYNWRQAIAANALWPATECKSRFAAHTARGGVPKQLQVTDVPRLSQPQRPTSQDALAVSSERLPTLNILPEAA